MTSKGSSTSNKICWCLLKYSDGSSYVFYHYWDGLSMNVGYELYTDIWYKTWKCPSLPAANLPAQKCVKDREARNVSRTGRQRAMVGRRRKSLPMLSQSLTPTRRQPVGSGSQGGSHSQVSYENCNRGAWKWFWCEHVEQTTFTSRSNIHMNWNIDAV